MNCLLWTSETKLYWWMTIREGNRCLISTYPFTNYTINLFSLFFINYIPERLASSLVGLFLLSRLYQLLSVRAQWSCVECKWRWRYHTAVGAFKLFIYMCMLLLWLMIAYWYIATSDSDTINVSSLLSHITCICIA